VPGRDATLTALVDELRGVGVGVSVGEHLDAARALASIPLADLDVLRKLADEFVRRFAALEPGAPVAGVFAMIAASQAASLDSIRAELLAASAGEAGDGAGGGPGGGAGGGSGGGFSGGGSAVIRDRLNRAEADRAVGRFRAELEAAIRRALVADRGAHAVSKTLRVRLAEDVDIATASATELEAMVTSIGPLAQQLSKLLAQQEFRKRRLSVRRTLHLAMGTGGVPFRIATEPAPPPKPEIVVLCDVSGSVATFSRFTLNLLIALDSRLSRLRAFSFVDGLAEITELVGEARSAGRQLTQAEAARGAIRWNGSSDYGHVLRDFAADYARQFSRRTVVLVVGDARTNYLNPAVSALAEVSDRVGKLYWLNPEPRRYWNQGDSVIGQYAPLCSQVRECSTLRQIADFVRSLTTGPASAH
jgi:uncharacterized protein with von Willebrand factor type A (vWA) domain